MYEKNVNLKLKTFSKIYKYTIYNNILLKLKHSKHYIHNCYIFVSNINQVIRIYLEVIYIHNTDTLGVLIWTMSVGHHIIGHRIVYTILISIKIACVIISILPMKLNLKMLIFRTLKCIIY